MYGGRRAQQAPSTPRRQTESRLHRSQAKGWMRTEEIPSTFEAANQFIHCTHLATPRAWQSVQKTLSDSVLREIRHFRLVQHLAPYSILDALYNQSVRKTACTPRSCSGKCLQFCLRLFSLESVHRRRRRISGRANRASLAMRANTSGTSLAGLGNSLEGSPGRHPWTLCQIGSARMHSP